ncbi:Protein of unknown function [Gryllus bimaculatus]|nr:Protein of unknown function [Gryllus bimaculatus]
MCPGTVKIEWNSDVATKDAMDPASSPAAGAGGGARRGACVCRGRERGGAVGLALTVALCGARSPRNRGAAGGECLRAGRRRHQGFRGLLLREREGEGRWWALAADVGVAHPVWGAQPRRWWQLAPGTSEAEPCRQIGRKGATGLVAATSRVPPTYLARAAGGGGGVRAGSLAASAAAALRAFSSVRATPQRLQLAAALLASAVVVAAAYQAMSCS